MPSDGTALPMTTGEGVCEVCAASCACAGWLAIHERAKSPVETTDVEAAGVDRSDTGDTGGTAGATQSNTERDAAGEAPADRRESNRMQLNELNADVPQASDFDTDNT